MFRVMSSWLNIIRMLSLSVSRTKTVKRLNRRPATPRWFWVRPGRTSAWWDNFVDQILQAVRLLYKGNKFMTADNFLEGLKPFLLATSCNLSQSQTNLMESLCTSLVYRSRSLKHPRAGQGWAFELPKVAMPWLVDLDLPNRACLKFLWSRILHRSCWVKATFGTSESLFSEKCGRRKL